MDEVRKFLSEISSIYWILSVLVVGLVIAILGEFLYKLSEKLISKFVKNQSEKIDKRKAKEKEVTENLINKLLNNEDLFHWHQIDVLNNLIFTTTNLILGSMVGLLTVQSKNIITNILATLIAFVFMWGAYKNTKLYIYKREITWRVLDRKKENPSVDKRPPASYS